MKKRRKIRILLSISISTILTLVIGYIFLSHYLKPHIKDIYLSKSENGIQLTAPVGPIVKNRPVPTGGYFEDGWIRLYADDGIYMRFIRLLMTKDNHFVRGLVVMKSKDGTNFQDEKMTLDTFPLNFAMMTDPCLIKTKEGFWRLYVVVWEQNEEGGITKPIHSMISSDGIDWQYESKVTDYWCIDPTVLYIEEKDHYILYCPSGRESAKVAFSSDGKEFGELQDYNLPAVHAAIVGEDGYLLYYESPGQPGMAGNGVAISKDGVEIEERFDLAVPMNDPAIIKHPDGSYYYYPAFPLIEAEKFNRD